MGYKHIDNLYKNQEILLFKRCYALEKIHGTSARITWKRGRLSFQSGGASHERFVSIFNIEDLDSRFMSLGHDVVSVYGEAYGGKIQGMSETYGKDLRFVAFEVKIGDTWLNVPNAANVAEKLSLEFVHFAEIDADVDDIDAQRDADSVQAIRNGMGEGKMREGVVLRPLLEFCNNRGERVVAKHKRDDFRETTKPRKVVSPEMLEVLTQADDVALEWVTEMRLAHVLDKIPDASMQNMRGIISAMIEDVHREGRGEIDGDRRAIDKAIGRRTAKLFKKMLQARLRK